MHVFQCVRGFARGVGGGGGGTRLKGGNPRIPPLLYQTLLFYQLICIAPLQWVLSKSSLVGK